MTIYNSINNAEVLDNSCTFLGTGAGNATFTPSSNNNTFLGALSGRTFTSAIECTFAGFSSGYSNQTGPYNSAFGSKSLVFNVLGQHNFAGGYSSLNLATGSRNLSVGSLSGSLLLSGTDNVFLGYDAGRGYEDAESDNIVIGSGVLGTTGESNVIRIGGGFGTGPGQQNHTFISACYSNLGIHNTFVGEQAGNNSIDLVNCIRNVCVGTAAGIALTTGHDNVLIGDLGALSLTEGYQSVIIGGQAGVSITTEVSNVIAGYKAGNTLTGSDNTLIGTFAGQFLLSATNNICIGYEAGQDYGNTETSNICIGNRGTYNENNVIRIGELSTQTDCYIQGINGATSTAGVAVLVNSTGKLGTTTSSIRYKENVKELSENKVLELNPVMFNYISDETKQQQYGLIAEEVEKIIPELVMYKDGKPETVYYQFLPILLLDEIKKLSQRVQELELKLAS